MTQDKQQAGEREAFRKWAQSTKCESLCAGMEWDDPHVVAAEEAWQARAALAPGQGVASAEPVQYGWLVENGKCAGDGLAYRCMNHGAIEWTEDPNKAIRFARRQDAEAFSQEDEDAWRIVEHGWHAAPQPVASAEPVPDFVMNGDLEAALWRWENGHTFGNGDESGYRMALYRWRIAASSQQEEPIECPECHGKGSVDVTHEPLRDGYTETFCEPCDHCEATGKVSAAPQPSALAALTDAEIFEEYARHDSWVKTVRAFATQKPSAGAMSDSQIREIFMAHGFTIKDGQTDLKPYVYAAARALLSAHGAQPQQSAAGRLRAVLYAIANTYDDHELRQRARDAYESDAAPAAQCQHDLRAEYEGENGVRAAICTKCHERVQTAPPAAQADDYKGMFEDAARDMAAIDAALGIDPEEAGGAGPILNAIEQLKASQASAEVTDMRAEFESALPFIGGTIHVFSTTTLSTSSRYLEGVTEVCWRTWQAAWRAAKPDVQLIEALRNAEKVIDILWVSHHASRADAVLDEIRALLDQRDGGEGVGEKGNG